MDQSALARSVERLVEFLGKRPLTTTIADLEAAVVGLEASQVAPTIERVGANLQLLTAAVRIRRDVGRLNDLIHATAILIALPSILEPGEVISNRPSLAAGNDPSRPYDLETNLRVAEFKLSEWKGSDAMRKRQTFKDLVHLAADQSGRRRDLFLIGSRPIHFLRTSRSTAAWALGRSPTSRLLYRQRFGRLETPIAEFTAGPGATVNLIQIEKLVPEVLVAADAASDADTG